MEAYAQARKEQKAVEVAEVVWTKEEAMIQHVGCKCSCVK